MTQKSYAAIVVALALGTSAPVLAEWPSEPAISPIQVTDSGGSPKIAVDNDGGTYVSYRNRIYNTAFPSSSGMDVLIQHYDAYGNPSWDAPITVYDTNKTFASYYGTVTDAQGNAYVANDIHEFNDLEHNAVHLTKITKDGKMPWGSLNLTPGVNPISNGLGITLDAHGNHIVTAWAKGASGLTVDVYSAIACTNSDGKILWSKDIQIDGKYTFVTKPIVTDDGVIVLIEVGIAPGTTQSHFIMQKYALTDGQPMWAQPVNITSGDNFSHPVDSGNSVQLKRDGHGGAVLSYYHITGPNQGTILLQHVHADGSKSFSGQGLRLSGDELGNGSTSLAYDGDNYYVTWRAQKIAANEEGVATQYSAIKGVAVDKNGKFIWNSDGSTNPSFLYDWQPEYRTGPVAGWFSGYVNPAMTLNENGDINLTYGVETIYQYYLYAQVLDPKTGVRVGESVNFSDGPIKVQGEMAFGRTIFGQPLLSYAVGDGSTTELRLLNFDGQAKSGVSQNVLVQKVMPVELTPNETKNITLKVLDSQSTNHDSSASSATGLVNANVTASEAAFTVSLSTEAWLADSDSVNVTVHDLDNAERSGVSTIKVQAPSYRPPRIMPLDNLSVEEGATAQVTAVIDAAEGAELEIQWQQTAGPIVELTSDGANLAVTTDYIAEDTVLTFNLSVSDDRQTVTQSVDIIVKNMNTPVINGSDTHAAPGEQFSFTPVFENAKAPVSVSWSQVDGARTVYTVDEDGALHGTAPLSEGTLTLAIQAVDANGESFTRDFSLSVAAPVAADSNGGGSLGGLSILLLGIMVMWKRTFGKKQL